MKVPRPTSHGGKETYYKGRRKYVGWIQGGDGMFPWGEWSEWREFEECAFYIALCMKFLRAAS